MWGSETSAHPHLVNPSHTRRLGAALTAAPQGPPNPPSGRHSPLRLPHHVSLGPETPSSKKDSRLAAVCGLGGVGAEGAEKGGGGRGQGGSHHRRSYRKSWWQRMSYLDLCKLSIRGQNLGSWPVIAARQSTGTHCPLGTCASCPLLRPTFLARWRPWLWCAGHGPSSTEQMSRALDTESVSCLLLPRPRGVGCAGDGVRSPRAGYVCTAGQQPARPRAPGPAARAGLSSGLH